MTQPPESKPAIRTKKLPRALRDAQALADGKNIFTLEQAADYCRATTAALQQASQRRMLRPAVVHGAYFFTRRDLDTYAQEVKELEIIQRLQNGQHPVDIVLEMRSVRIRDVNIVMDEWARAAGMWIVEGPPGSYARWLERFGITTCNPRLIRRVLEACLLDDYVATLCRAKLAAWREEDIKKRASSKMELRAKILEEAASELDAGSLST